MEDLTQTEVSRRMENLVTKKIKAIIIFWFVCNIFVTVMGSVADGNFGFFALLNCSCNIIFYYLFDAKFKQILKSLFTFCCAPSSQQVNANETKDDNVKTVASTGGSNEN